MVPATDPATAVISQYKMIYAQSIKYGDFSSASVAVFGILANDTANLGWKDTLAILFFARQAYSQALEIGKEVYSKQPDNTRILELIAVSEENLGDSKDALGYYEQLYAKTKDLYHLYQIISLQYELKRLAECSSNINDMVADPRSAKEEITLSIGQNQQQKVFYKAAALNIRGVMARELKQDDVAEQSFTQALQVNPDFALAKANLDELHKAKQGTPAPNTPKDK